MAQATRPVAPRNLAATARAACPGFRTGRQEDAHEFVRGLLAALCRAEVAGCSVSGPPLTPKMERRSAVHAIFAGILESSVVCTECRHVSTTREPFLDLSLEINGVASVPAALQRFTAAERLDGGNRYRCAGCKRLVVATKRFAIRRAPNVLALHLKRFDRSRKDVHQVKYPPKLDLAPYMHGKPPAVAAVYNLSAVLIHHGSSPQYGHYYAYVKDAHGEWSLKDDAVSRSVAPATALRQKAYMLFYTRVPSAKESSPVCSSPLIPTKVPTQRPMQNSRSCQSTTLQSKPDAVLRQLNSTGGAGPLTTAPLSTPNVSSPPRRHRVEVRRPDAPKPPGQNGKGPTVVANAHVPRQIVDSPASKKLETVQHAPSRGKHAPVTNSPSHVVRSDPDIIPAERKDSSATSTTTEGDSRASLLSTKLSASSAKKKASKLKAMVIRKVMSPPSEPQLPSTETPTTTGNDTDETVPSASPSSPSPSPTGSASSSADRSDSSNGSPSMRAILIGGTDAVRKVMRRVFGVSDPPVGGKSVMSSPPSGQSVSSGGQASSGKFVPSKSSGGKLGRRSTSVETPSARPADSRREKVVGSGIPELSRTRSVPAPLRANLERRNGTSSLFIGEGVDVWNTAENCEPEPERLLDSDEPRIKKRKRANDELDEEYDRGKQKKVKQRYANWNGYTHSGAGGGSRGVRARSAFDVAADRRRGGRW